MSEKKYKPEEIRAIVDGELRKANLNSRRELSASELEKVNAGTMIVPDTHEEIDQKMDILQRILDVAGPDATLIAAQEMQLVPGTNGSGRSNPFDGGSVDLVRNWMHMRLDNINNGIKEDYVTIY